MINSNNYKPTKKNDLLEKGLDVQINLKRAKLCLRFGVCSTLVLLICIYEISHQYPVSCKRWYYAEYVIGTIAAFGSFCYFVKYIWYFFQIEKVQVTKDQKCLLRFDDRDDASFAVINPKDTDMTPNNSLKDAPLNRTLMTPKGVWNLNLSNNSFSNLSLGTNKSWNSSDQNSGARIDSFYSPYQKFDEKDSITNEKSLERFLSDVSMNSDSSPVTSDSYYVQESLKTLSANSFWGYYNSASTLLRTSLYQLSPPSELTQNTMNDKNESVKDEVNVGEHKISCDKLAIYVGNLRMWLSVTILKRIVAELEKIDKVYSSRGFCDTQIGSIGLERLKKSVENQQFVIEHVPTLPKIIPFLEISTNQQYLVQRIKDLAQGSCLSNYRWSQNTSLHYGVFRDENNPTDAAIMFHLFCTYLDSQLLPLPQPGGRPFFNRYVVISENKNDKEIVSAVKNKAKCAILCSNLLKPNFNFICDNKVHSCAYNRNNLFNVIIHFLKYMRDTQSGLLEGVYLGESGINILCVLQDHV